MRSLKVLLAALAVVAGGSVPGAAPASATPAAESSAQFVSVPFSLQPTTSNVITCLAQIGYPHNSSHVPGTVNTLATVNCDAAVSWISITVRLYYNNVLISSSGPSTRYATTNHRNNAATTCLPGIYRGEADVTVSFPPGYVPPVQTAYLGTPDRTITCA